MSPATREYEIDGYRIGVSYEMNIEFLRENWQRLERKNPVPFFLTWHWISCWLQSYQPSVITISARFEGDIVAIGLLTESLETRHTIVRSKQFRLHQMGDILMDQIWMEYNDFLCDDEHREKVVNACLSVLQGGEFNWDEIVMSMMSKSRAQQILDQNRNSAISLTRPCYAVDLNAIRDSGQTYLKGLAANTRYQINRSIRLYEKLYGPLNIQLAESMEQAHAFFHEAGSYHILKWSDSGYKNRLFVKFHENLIDIAFNDDAIKLMRVTAGKQTLAVMYYQLVGKSVYFYLHGLNYEDNKKLKPGLVAHALAAQFFIEAGLNEYDFMGGYSQYKEQLASRTEDLVTIVLQRPRSQFKLERCARKIKKWFNHS